MLPFLLAALTFAVLLPVLLPLLRGQGTEQDGAMFDQAVYRDQLREIDRDIERGLMTETEAVTVRLEVQRRLLAVEPDSAPVHVRKDRALAVIAGLFVAGGALGVFLYQAPSATPSAQAPEANAVARLADHLRTHPDDAEGWAVYARAVSRLERWADAETAWRRAIALGDATPDALAGMGEVLVMRGGGTVGSEAHGLFDMALRGDPRNDVARYYLALEMSQTGDPAGAIARWRAMLDDMPLDAPGRADVTHQIEQTARAAGIPLPAAEDRKAMIEAMVARLAARLAQEPGDGEGWARLGRAYAVMGKAEAAADAYEKAAALIPSDPSLRRLAAEALLAGLKPEDALPQRALDLLRQVETALPGDPAVLWYLGLAAAREKHVDTARDYWTRLIRVLPPDGADAKMVRAALEALSGRP